MHTTQRTNLVLERWQVEMLRSMAEQRGRSISDLVREILTRHLEEGETLARQRSAVRRLKGIFSGDGSSARDHDRLLYGAPRRRARR